MRAAVIKESHEVEVITVEDPVPGRRDVVVEVAACGICGTDLHILEGEFAPSLPIVPGHEFTGVVVATGSDVDEITSGQRVAVDPSLYCFECHYCKIGHNNLCERWNAIGTPIKYVIGELERSDDPAYKTVSDGAAFIMTKVWNGTATQEYAFELVNKGMQIGAPDVPLADIEEIARSLTAGKSSTDCLAALKRYFEAMHPL